MLENNLNVNGAKGSVGITDYAQNSLGDIVFVDLPKVGDKVEAGKIFGSVESVKAVSDLFSPVSGTVTAINEELKTAPERINADANKEWMLKITLTNPAEVDGLLSAAFNLAGSILDSLGTTELRSPEIREVLVWTGPFSTSKRVVALVNGP